MKTKIFIIVVSSVAIVGNIILIATGNTSVSATLQKLSGDLPIVPFAIGVLIGHWFWPVGGDKKMTDKFKSRKFVAACWAGIIATLWGTVSILTKDYPPWLGVVMPMLIGIIGAYVGIQGLIDKGAKK